MQAELAAKKAKLTEEFAIEANTDLTKAAAELRRARQCAEVDEYTSGHAAYLATQLDAMLAECRKVNEGEQSTISLKKAMVIKVVKDVTGTVRTTRMHDAFSHVSIARWQPLIFLIYAR